MNPISAPLDAQRRAMERATDSVERAAVAPDRAETMAGVEVGTTPSEVVYEENKLELHHYEPAERRHDVPILIVYALINRPYILDLQPDRSVVRRLLDAGFDVYLIDWGEPSTLDTSLALSDYVNRYTDNCVDVVCDRAGVESVNLLGYCMGGTMSVMYAALFPEKVRNLGLMAAGLCFDDTGGVLEQWGRGEHFEPGRLADVLGNVPAEFLATGFDLMDPVTNYVSKYLQLYENLEDEEFVTNFARMERWLDDGIDVAGEAYREFLTGIYQENALYENEFELDGEHVDLGAIDMPVLQIVGEYDHLIPPAASTPFNEAAGSEDTEVIEFSTGHIGLSVSSSSHEELWPRVADWFAARSTDGEDEPASDGDPEAAGRSANDAGEAASAEPSGDGTTDEATDDGPAGLESVEGIGPTYAERLRDAGVQSVADLAAAEPAVLAGRAGIAEGRLRTLIERAGR